MREVTGRESGRQSRDYLPKMSSASAQLWAFRAAFRTLGRVAPDTAARWAASIFRRPPRPVSRPGDEAFLSAGTRFDVVSRGQRLAAWEWGSGPVVLLAHGWGSRAARLSALSQAIAGAGYRAVAWDAPAHGVSEGRYASLPEFAWALRDVADLVGAVYGVVGHSLGGAAAALALAQGLGTERAVLVAAPADVVVYSHAFADHLHIPPRAHDAMRRNLEATLQMRWEDLHLPTLARAMTVPLLVVHDRDDPDVPFTHGEAIAQAWPGAELLATRGLGHRAVLRDPLVVSRVVGFLGG